MPSRAGYFLLLSLSISLGAVEGGGSHDSGILHCEGVLTIGELMKVHVGSYLSIYHRMCRLRTCFSFALFG